MKKIIEEKIIENGNTRLVKDIVVIADREELRTSAYSIPANVKFFVMYSPIKKS